MSGFSLAAENYTEGIEFLRITLLEAMALRWLPLIEQNFILDRAYREASSDLVEAIRLGNSAPFFSVSVPFEEWMAVFMTGQSIFPDTCASILKTLAREHRDDTVQFNAIKLLDDEGRLCAPEIESMLEDECDPETRELLCSLVDRYGGWSRKQHDEAKRLLPIIVAAAKSHKLLTYQTAAQKLGRPKNHACAVAQVCDLLDAAAAIADVPVLALTTVLDSNLRVNREAWAELPHWIRDAIIKRSQRHTFTKADIKAIEEGLEKLKDYGNRRAWRYLKKLMPAPRAVPLRLAGVGTTEHGDAIDDLGTDNPGHETYSGKRYARDTRVREAVKRRAGGKCEFCGKLGFKSTDGLSVLECHHILALAKDGADRMDNVIAICAHDHREAHFGKRRKKWNQG